MINDKKNLAPTHLYIKCWGHVIGRCVHLYNLDLLVSHLLAQLVIDGRQLLTMSTPDIGIVNIYSENCTSLIYQGA